MDMNNGQGIDNKVFMSAFAGVILLVLTAFISVVSLKQLPGQLALTAIITAVTGLPSLGLLLGAIKKDKRSTLAFAE